MTDCPCTHCAMECKANRWQRCRREYLQRAQEMGENPGEQSYERRTA